MTMNCRSEHPGHARDETYFLKLETKQEYLNQKDNCSQHLKTCFTQMQQTMGFFSNFHFFRLIKCRFFPTENEMEDATNSVEKD